LADGPEKFYHRDAYLMMIGLAVYAALRNFQVPFDIGFPLIFDKKAKRNRQKKHEEFLEIGFPVPLFRENNHLISGDIQLVFADLIFFHVLFQVIFFIK